MIGRLTGLGPRRVSKLVTPTEIRQRRKKQPLFSIYVEITMDDLNAQHTEGKQQFSVSEVTLNHEVCSVYVLKCKKTRTLITSLEQNFEAQILQV